MRFRNAIWTYLIVTATAALIWGLAATATRERRSLVTTLHFNARDGGRWLIEPPQRRVTIEMEGSPLAIQNAEATLRPALGFPITAEPGETTVDLLSDLRTSESVLATGVRMLSVEPATLVVTFDDLRSMPASVRPGRSLAEQTKGQIEVEPPEVTMLVPSSLAPYLDESPVAEVLVEATALQELESDRRHVRTARVRLPEAAALRITEYGGNPDHVSFEPAAVDVSFILGSRIREITLENVRVQLAGPHEDFSEFDILLQPAVLRNVTVSGDEELIRRIETRSATVIAMLHLSNREKEQSIESKPIACFLVLEADGTAARPVTARVGDAAESPVINLSISRREQGTEGLRD
jgi:hypothetical protein